MKGMWLEALRNPLRHPWRFVLLFLAVLVSAMTVFVVLTVFNTAALVTQPTLPEDVRLMTVKLAPGAVLRVTPTQLLHETKLEGEWVYSGSPLVGRGLSFKVYGFSSAETTERWNPDKTLLQGHWPQNREAVLSRRGCALLRCSLGSMLRLYSPESKRDELYKVSGFVDTPDTLAVLTSPAFPATQERLWRFWIKSELEDEVLEQKMDAFFEKYKVNLAEPTFATDRFGETMFARAANFALLRVLTPILGVALFACALIIVFNFAVNRLERAREVAIKRAYGASSAQIMLESLLEALMTYLLSVGPALLLGGVLLSVVAQRFLAERAQNLLAFDWPPLLYTAGIILGLVVLAALGPTWATSRMQPAPQLKEE